MDEMQKKLLEDQNARTKFAQDLAIEQIRRAQLNPQQLEQDGFQTKQNTLNFQPHNPLGTQAQGTLSPEEKMMLDVAAQQARQKFEKTANPTASILDLIRKK